MNSTEYTLPHTISPHAYYSRGCEHSFRRRLHSDSISQVTASGTIPQAQKHSAMYRKPGDILLPRIRASLPHTVCSHRGPIIHEQTPWCLLPTVENSTPRKGHCRFQMRMWNTEGSGAGEAASEQLSLRSCKNLVGPSRLQVKNGVWCRTRW